MDTAESVPQPSVPNRLGHAPSGPLVDSLVSANRRAATVRGRRSPDSPAAVAAVESAEILATLLTQGYSAAEIGEATGMKPSQVTARLKLVTRLSVHQLRSQAFRP